MKPLEDSISWLNVNVSTPGRHLADEGRRRQRHIRADSTRTPAAETSTQGLGEGVGHGKRARATPRATVDYVPTNCFANTFFFVVNNFSICCCFAFLFYVLIFGVFFAAFSSAICWRNKQQQQRQQQHRTPFVCRCVCKHAMCGTSIVGCLCTAARTCNSCTMLFFFFASFCCSLNERAQSEHLINSRFCFEDYFAGDTGPKSKSKWQRHSKLFTYFTITLNIPSKIYRIFAVQLLANGHMLVIPLVFLVFFLNCYWSMIVFKMRLFCCCEWFAYCITFAKKK